MPGIVGIIGKDLQKDGGKQLALMVNPMLHERFYSSGTHVFSELGIAVGWVAIKGSFGDCMPVWNETRDICLIFSGEHFGDIGEPEGLGARGHIFREGGASYLVHLYEEQGERFFETLNGSFCGLLVDLRQQRAILFNDRYGLSRVYYHEAPERLYFASEAKSLLKVLPHLRQLDPQGWGEQFTCGCVLQNRTLFSGVSLLPGGAAWLFERGLPPSKQSYFRREEWEDQSALSEADFYEALRGTVETVVPRYFRGPEQVAMSLTGGLDSRLIMAWAPAPPYKLRCYTFGGIHRECADVRIARRVALVSQQHHEVVAVNRKLFAEFAGLAKRSVYFTDGAMDVSGAVELFVNRMAREIAPVRLTGNYGDEVLRQNVAFNAGFQNRSIFSRDFLPHLDSAISCYSEEKRGSRASFIAFKQVPWHHYGRRALEQTQLTVRSPFLDNQLAQLIYRVPPGMATSVDVALDLISDGHEALATFPTDRGHKRSSHGLFRRFRELGPSVMTRAEYAYDYGMPQRLARLDHLLAPMRLERFFLGRSKFYHFRSWYRDELSGYVKEVLLDPRTLARSYLHRRNVEKMVGEHVQGLGNHTREIHKLLTSEIIERQLIEKG